MSQDSMQNLNVSAKMYNSLKKIEVFIWNRDIRHWFLKTPIMTFWLELVNALMYTKVHY